MLNTCSIAAAQDAYAKGDFAKADTVCLNILRDAPNDVPALRLWSKLSLDKGDGKEAIRILAQALSVDPSQPDVRCDIAAACHKANRSQDAIEHLMQVIVSHADCFRAFGQLANIYYEIGLIEDAARVYRQWHALDPGQVEVSHMAIATSGHSAPAQCSMEFVRTHFNGLATTFNKRLVGDLGYVGHHVVCDAFIKFCDVDADKCAVLDAGCGTGLCGLLLKEHCKVLIGVDLAEKMIEQAAETGAYDELIVEDICVHMRGRSGAYDVIITADVLIYIGDLKNLLESANFALTAMGLFVATLEQSAEESAVPYRLEPHGRYSHREGYLRNTMQESGFEVLHLTTTSLRRELGKDVLGLVVVGRKRV